MQILRCETPPVTVTTEGLHKKGAFPDHLPPMSNLISGGDEPAAKLSNHVGGLPIPPMFAIGKWYKRVLNS